jgi:protocatechuate 3,4-dioxygenase beta subunit
MRRLAGVALVLLTAAAVAAADAPAAGTPAATTCRATPTDAFGPFGRGTPPFRARIGRGHVLTGVVLSALGCAPLARARVELWQSNRRGEYTRATSASVLTDRAGRFRFEGPFPPSYEGRPAHIHVRVFARGHEVLMTRVEPRRGTRRTVVRWVLRPALV